MAHCQFHVKYGTMSLESVVVTMNPEPLESIEKESEDHVPPSRW